MKVEIRPLRREDAYTSQKWRNDPEVFKFTGNTYSSYITIESELEWIEKVMANKDEYRCAIMADDEYVGNIYLTNIKDGKAVYHIFIGNKDYWGKGVAKQASERIIEYGFKHLQLDEIRLKVRDDNTLARRLYRKLGFIEKNNQYAWIVMVLNSKGYRLTN